MTVMILIGVLLAFISVLQIHSQSLPSSIDYPPQQPHTASVISQPVHNLPFDYDLKSYFVTQFAAGQVLYSPDQNWIIYKKLFQSQGPTIYFRHRSSFKEYSTVVIEHDVKEYIQTFAFNPKGDRLLIGTDHGNLYLCKFHPLMTADDCQVKFSAGTLWFFSITDIHINSKDRIALICSSTLWLLSINRAGEFVVQFNHDFGDYSSLQIKWHPKDEQIIIIGGYKTKTTGILAAYNVTSQNYSQVNTIGVDAFDIFPNGQMILAATLRGVDAYAYARGSFFQVGVIPTTPFNDIRISNDGNLVTMYQFSLSSSSQVQIFSVNRLSYHSNQKTNTSQPSLNLTSFLISLKLLYSIPLDRYSQYTTSSDNNQILVTFQANNLIKQYVICRNNMLISNLTCLKCSSNCSTCHLSYDLCLSCANDSYVLDNGVCFDCYKMINGCLTCANVSYCLTCNTSTNFQFKSDKGKCVCQNFYSLSNKKCILCDSSSICKKCQSPNQCILCNTDNNWNSTPVNGICVCQDFHYRSFQKCLPCDSFGVCKECSAQYNCKSCDYSQGFKQEPENGTCVCQNSYNYVNHKCIQCFIEGCHYCEAVNICNWCSENEGYGPSPNEEGRCIKNNNLTFIIIGSCIGVLILIAAAIVLYRKYKSKPRLEVLKERESRVSDNEYPQKLFKPLLQEDIQKVKYSDEERIRLQKLQQSIISN